MKPSKQKSRADATERTEVQEKPKGRGRPTDYQEAYCDELIEHMKDGLSFESFAGVVGVHRDTLYEWEKVQPQFSDAKKIGVEKARLYWERLGLLGTSGARPGFSAAMWIFNMKNRFKGEWKDTQHVEGNSNVNHSGAIAGIPSSSKERAAMRKAILAEISELPPVPEGENE